ncbi:beta-lactamase family protein [Vibrio lamellibrachiae]|uniref:serine hydrolase domain-containing protein n=1 Tax=Vibrio lamellibrachiae TaxID=2910253 RepID=UPI003D0E35B9
MLKHSMLDDTLEPSINEKNVTNELRQKYRKNFSLMSFMAPGEQASWYWRNMEQVIPASRIRADSASSIPLKRDLLNPNTVYNTNYADRALGDLLLGDKPAIDSLMITKNGKVVFEHFNMPYNEQHVWMSNAKTIAGLLIALLEEEGKIDVSNTLITYLPELADSDWKDVKVIDVLNMQSGMDVRENAEARSNPNTSIAQIFMAETGHIPDYLDTLLRPKKQSEAGKAFEYSSANTQILGMLIARVENKTLSKVFEQRIWSKAGMSSDGIMSLTPDGFEIVHGIYSSNTEDMARYAMLFTDSWPATAKERLISENVVKTIRTSFTKGVYLGNEEMGNHFVNMIGEQPLGASYQFDAIWEDGDMFKSGMEGQGIYISPDKNMTAVWFSNRGENDHPATYIRQFMKAQ